MPACQPAKTRVPDSCNNKSENTNKYDVGKKLNMAE